MAEVFNGTPDIVGVTVSDQEGRAVTFHIAGRDMSVVKEAVRFALEQIPDEAAPVKKARKKRRSKAEMRITGEDVAAQAGLSKTEVSRRSRHKPENGNKELVGAGHMDGKGSKSIWPAE